MKTMKIESVFQPLQSIPSKYTCDGENIAPPLSFIHVPEFARSLVLIMDDPDAQDVCGKIFDHWIVGNIPVDIHKLSEGAPELLGLSHDIFVGKNHYNLNTYKGPCPPPGKPHHYHFKLYALDQILSLPYGVTKEDVEDAMKGHVIEQAELIGIYQR